MKRVSKFVGAALFVLMVVVIADWLRISDHWRGNADNDLVPAGADVDHRAVRAAIFSGAVLIRNYREDHRKIDILTKGLELARQSGITENIRRSEQALEDGKKRRALSYKVYLAQLMQSAHDYSTRQHVEQLEAVKQQLAQQGMKSIERFAELYVKQIDAYNNNHDADEAGLGKEIRDFQP